MRNNPGLESRLGALGLISCLLISLSACAETPAERKQDPTAAGIYRTWDDVVNRWIGEPRDKLGYEFGPPTFHKEADDGSMELVWDMTYPNASGQAQMYNTLPMYGGVNCKLVFITNPDGIVESGRRIGCN